MRNFAKRLNETDRNVSRNLSDYEISVQTQIIKQQISSSFLAIHNTYDEIQVKICMRTKRQRQKNIPISLLLGNSQGLKLHYRMYIYRPSSEGITGVSRLKARSIIRRRRIGNLDRGIFKVIESGEICAADILFYHSHQSISSLV